MIVKLGVPTNADVLRGAGERQNHFLVRFPFLFNAADGAVLATSQMKTQDCIAKWMVQTIAFKTAGALHQTIHYFIS